jgi:outer membrane protein assembly factor BamD (BamD/ComL family)
MLNKFYQFFFLASVLMIQSCAFQEFRGNPDEQVVYNRIQELRKSERYILAAEYAKKFKEHFPKSDKVEELDLFVADQDYKSEHWDMAKERYKAFIEEHPKSPKASYAQEQLKDIDVQVVSFHKHFDYNIYAGPQLYSTEDFNKATEAPNMMQIAVTLLEDFSDSCCS